MNEFINRHEKIALMFSGGKDSIACLELYRAYLDKITVIWVNTGANFPEIEEYMEQLNVPNFVEIRTNQPLSLQENGHPVDVLPVNYSNIGQAVTTKKDIKLRTYFDCCAENQWIPAHLKVEELGITCVIRGQRQAESHKNPIKSGEVIDGVEYVFPILGWSDQDVLEYLKSKNIEITERLSMSHSSLDCWNCTAYVADSKERFEYIKKHYPQKHEAVVNLLKKIDNVVTAELSAIRQITEV
jgi:3'-phosphoadenosine 5'-phosphosulfate sulfotransferase (PAPS reductase)/FAD synthetase